MSAHCLDNPVDLLTLELVHTFEELVAAVHRNRPRRLGNDPSPDALRGRAAEIDAIAVACKEYLKAAVEDISQHCYARERLTDIVEAPMGDMVHDLRGLLVDAINERAVA